MYLSFYIVAFGSVSAASGVLLTDPHKPAILYAPKFNTANGISLFGGCKVPPGAKRGLHPFLIYRRPWVYNPRPQYWDDSTGSDMIGSVFGSILESRRASHSSHSSHPSPSQHFYTRFCQNVCVRSWMPFFSETGRDSDTQLS